MIIKTLKLIDFGKFSNKSIELKAGLNIVFGENEAGKTTIHNFIDGMFYGFLKPYVKSTIYTLEHKKYKPWNSNSYKGIISFRSKGEDYRIERVFDKGNESTRVLLENTGEDITYSIDNGDNSRVLQPGNEFLGISNGVYSNTVSIKQLGSKTEGNLANELRDKLVNLSSSNDDKISVDLAIKDIEKSLKDIGTIKAPTSIYGGLNSTIDRLKNEKHEILKLKDEYEALIDIKNELENSLTDLNNKLSEEKRALDNALKLEKVKTYYEIKDITNTMRVLKLQLDELSSYKNLSSEDYSKGIDIENEIKIIDSRLEDLEPQIRDIEETIKNIFLNKENLDSKKLEDIFYDYLSYDRLEQDKNKLIYKQNNSNLEFLREDYHQTKNSRLKYLILIGLFVAIYLTGVYFSWIHSSLLEISIVQLLIIPIGMLIQRFRRNQHLLKRIDQQIKELLQQMDNSKRDIIYKENEQRIILDRYSLSSWLELKSYYEYNQKKKYIYDEQIKSLDENKDKLSVLNNKLKELNLKKKEYSRRLELLLVNNGVESLNMFNNGLEFKNTYEDTLIHYNSKKELLNKILGNSSIEDFKEYSDEASLDFDGDPKDVVEERILKLNEMIQNNLLENRGIEEKINYLIPKISRLVCIDEEILRHINKLKDLDKKIRSLDLAKSTMEQLSKNIHNQFAPEINVKVGEIIGEITNGKYDEVKIDNKLSVGVINPNTSEIIDIDSLSGGTIDQLYFSLRFGIINSITDINVPLILDDCFIQYDDKRLENILAFLYKISKDRQVILFTCQKREKNILDNMNVNVNLITLS